VALTCENNKTEIKPQQNYALFNDVVSFQFRFSTSRT